MQAFGDGRRPHDRYRRGQLIRLTDPAVSRFHAELRAAQGGIAVVDHSSTNGTFAGAVRIERALVPPGTQLRVGDGAANRRRRAGASRDS